MPNPEPGRREHAPPGSSLLVGLTPDQAQAVTHGTGPLLLIADPGAGKTRTLTHRIAYLLQSQQARPDQILAVTFSVRAAGEPAVAARRPAGPGAGTRGRRRHSPFGVPPALAPAAARTQASATSWWRSPTGARSTCSGWTGSPALAVHAAARSGRP